MAEEIRLEAWLEDRGNGWRMTPWVSIRSGFFVHNPASTKGHDILGPALVRLEVAPDGGRTLVVDEGGTAVGQPVEL